MSYVLVTADFPGVTGDQRSKIYKCLVEKSWKKIQEPGRDIDTVWQASFKADVSEKDAIRVTINEFVECSKPYCNPKLAVHWGPTEPTRYGLT